MKEREQCGAQKVGNPLKKHPHTHTHIAYANANKDVFLTYKRFSTAFHSNPYSDTMIQTHMGLSLEMVLIIPLGMIEGALLTFGKEIN